MKTVKCINYRGGVLVRCDSEEFKKALKPLLPKEQAKDVFLLCAAMFELEESIESLESYVLEKCTHPLQLMDFPLYYSLQNNEFGFCSGKFLYKENKEDLHMTELPNFYDKLILEEFGDFDDTFSVSKSYILNFFKSLNIKLYELED